MEALRTLDQLTAGTCGIIERLDLPEEFAHRLMQMGFIPGTRVELAHAAPGGDPKVFRVDGSEVALRRETATHLMLHKCQTCTKDPQARATPGG